MQKFAKTIFTLSGLAAATLLLSACATTPSNSLAIQKENNLFEVTGLGKSAIIAKNNAVSAANKSCGTRNTPIVVDEKTAYSGALKGVVDEQTGQLIQAAATVLGNIAGTKTGINGDQDYQTTLTFRCQANS
jgi:predicted lipoprotein with Yx(FWY)xxD motif